MASGRIHVYTGEGKGKTTAALGLAVRAAGAGLRTLIIQFLKGQNSSEREALRSLGEFITIRSYGTDQFVVGEGTALDHQAAEEALSDAVKAMKAGDYDLLVLDEVLQAVCCQVIRLGALLDLLDHRPNRLELILTGRGAQPEIIERADLVSEIHAVKHYYSRGVEARKGIEY